MMRKADDYFDGMPDRFDDICGVILHYGRQGRNHDKEEWYQFLQSLSVENLEEISVVYKRMEETGDAATLSAWINEVRIKVWRRWNEWQRLRKEADEKGVSAPHEPLQVPAAKLLFQAFEALAELGVKPFTSKRVQYEEPKPDWTRLPRQLHYLIKPAETWGGYQAYEEIDRLKRQIGPNDLKELRDLAVRLRSSGDWLIADEWNSSMSWVEHREAALMHWFLHLLNDMFPELKK